MHRPLRHDRKRHFLDLWGRVEEGLPLPDGGGGGKRPVVVVVGGGGVYFVIFFVVGCLGLCWVDVGVVHGGGNERQRRDIKHTRIHTYIHIYNSI